MDGFVSDSSRQMDDDPRVSAGSFSVQLDGSDIGLDDDDISGAWLNNATGELFAAGLNGFDAPALDGDGDDVFVFTGADGNVASGTISLFLDGDTVGFGGE